jgi:hypothetical protein
LFHHWLYTIAFSVLPLGGASALLIAIGAVRRPQHMTIMDIEWVCDFIFAVGFVVHSFAIVPMRKLSPGKGLVAALKADSLYGGMANLQFAIFRHSFGAIAPAARPNSGWRCSWRCWGVSSPRIQPTVGCFARDSRSRCKAWPP